MTNLAFLGALAEHEGVGRGELDTGLIARDREALTRAPAASAADAALAGMAAMGLLEGAGPEVGFTLWAPLERGVMLRFGGDEIPVTARVLRDGAVDCARKVRRWRRGRLWCGRRRRK